MALGGKISVSTEFEGQRFRNGLGQFSAKSGRVWESALSHARIVGRAEAYRRVPVKTGRLQLSIRASKRGDEVIISARTPYAGVIEKGYPKKLTIRAKGRAMKFTGKRDGKTLYKKTVVRPRIKAQPFLQPAIDKAAAAMIAQIKKSF